MPYQASGLGSGMDTLSIIDQFVELQRQPITALQKRQSTVQTQISKIGEVSSKISALSSAATSLGTYGIRTSAVTSSNTAFSATAGTGSTVGKYDVQVTALAQSAKWRSGAFASASDVVSPGSLSFSVSGTTYNLSVGSGTSLTSLASQINGLGAPITASILTVGSGSYLTIEANETGYPTSGAPSAALSITESSTPGTGTALGLASIQTASNAAILVDGFSVTSRSNTFDGVIPGVSITAKSVGAAESLVIGTDNAASAKKLQTFFDALKDAVTLIDDLTANTPTKKGLLASDATLRGLSSSLHRLTTTTVSGLSGVSTLGDLGIGHDRSGLLSFDSSKLTKALAANPLSVDSFFTQATTGMSQIVKDLATQATTASTGSLSARSDGLRRISTDYSNQVTRMNRNLESYRKLLETQFTAMETTVGGLKQIGNYLTQMQQAKSKG